MTRAGASAFAPGRVNLIGEHTDYNEGLCLPFSLARGVTVQATPTDGPDTTVHTRTFDEHDHFDAEHPEWADGWRAFARGVAAELRDAGHAISPARLEVSSDLPTAAGMASSAAYEVALALALLALSGEQDLDRGAIARLCSRVENEWVGARTGLVDQFSSLFGRSDSALLLDFRAMTVDPVPLRLDGWSLATLQSGADRSLAGSGYNDRADECRRAAAMLGLKSLREATPDAVATLPEPYRRRARHVVSENGRVRCGGRGARRRRSRASGRAAGCGTREPARRPRGLGAPGRSDGGAREDGGRAGREVDGRRLRRQRPGPLSTWRGAPGRGHRGHSRTGGARAR